MNKKTLSQLKKTLRAEPQIAEGPDEEDLFQQTIKGVKPLVQDTYVPPRKATPFRQSHARQSAHERQRNASFSFSDMYEAHFSDTGPLRFCRENVPAYELKRLRRGDYYPEYILDLHGLTRDSAKLELSALIDTARKEWVDCVCIVHGIGSGVLKTSLPHYLVQHPHVKAFHQAPLEYGGHGALLVLLALEQDAQPKR